MARTQRVVGVEVVVVRHAGVGDVVDDAEREAVAGRVERGRDHRGRELLGAEPVATADDARLAPFRLRERSNDVEVERVARRARFLGPVEHDDRVRRLGQRTDEVLDRERPVQPHLQQPDLLAARNERVDGFGRGART